MKEALALKLDSSANIYSSSLHLLWTITYTINLSFLISKIGKIIITLMVLSIKGMTENIPPTLS